MASKIIPDSLPARVESMGFPGARLAVKDDGSLPAFVSAHAMEDENNTLHRMLQLDFLSLPLQLDYCATF